MMVLLHKAVAGGGLGLTRPPQRPNNQVDGRVARVENRGLAERPFAA